MAEDPVYDPVSTSEEQEDKPPSYFNIISQIKNAKAEAKSPTELGSKTFQIICGSFISTICLGILTFIPITSVVIGIYTQEKCKIQPKIPLWLIVNGAGGIATAGLKLIGNIIICAKSRNKKQNSEPKVLSCFNFLLSTFLLIWFFIGNYWVYSIYNRVQYDETVDPDTYCDKLCYLFSFWSITASWILLGLACFCMCGILCLVCGVGACALKS